MSDILFLAFLKVLDNVIHYLKTAALINSFGKISPIQSDALILLELNQN